MSIEKTARDYLHTNFGNLITIGEGVFEDAVGLHRFPLRSMYPYTITEDAERQKRQVKAIRMEGLGWIYIDEKTGRVDVSRTTKREEAIALIKEYLDFWRDRSERIIANVTCNSLSRINQFRIFFTPIDRIVGLIEMVGALTDRDISEQGVESDKTLRYTRLLEGLDLLTRKDGEWQPSILFHKIRTKYKTFDDRIRHIIAIIFKERYRTIRTVFKFNNVERIIRLQNVVYLPEIEMKRNLLRKTYTIQEEYRRHYGTQLSRLVFLGDMAGLIDVDVIKQDDEKRLSGQGYFLESMVEQASQLKPLHMVYQGASAGTRKKNGSNPLEVEIERICC